MVLQKNSVAKLPQRNTRNDGFLSRLVLSWVYEVIGMGRSGKLRAEDLKMPSSQATEEVVDKFDKNWHKELELQAKGGKPSLIRALWRSFGSEFIAAGACKLLWSFFVLMAAFYFVRSLTQYVEDPGKKTNEWNTNPIPNKGVGWVLSVSFFIDSLLVGIALQRMGDFSVRLGIKIRAALMASVYRKSFRIKNLHDDDSESGNVVSMVGTDCAKLYEGVQHCQNVWTAPLEAGAIIGLLLSLTGVYGLPALGVVLIVLPLQYYFGYRIASYKSQCAQVADARVLRMHEILLAIKLVKFYVWEKSFSKQVEDVRRQEMSLIKSAAVIKTLNLCLVFAVPPLIALVIFAAYSFTHGKLDASMSFVVLSLFNTLRFPLVVLPKALRGASEAAAAVKRLQAFLTSPDTEQTARSPVTEASMDHAVMNHPAAPEEFKLCVEKFNVKAGEVVAIVGRVGMGKSSVLHAILGNMSLEKGSLRVGGSVAYVPQTPWVQNLSLRDNILFGLPMDEEKYKAVIHACALELDLQILPNGDASMAGERGINLSGGQRQRVCLARAVYHNCDMVLLDNPLSAVDQHTSKHIFDKCIKGLLKDKAVVLIAHQLELLPQCDKVAIMHDGSMVYFGPYDPEALNEFMPVDHMLYATVEASESAVKPTAEERKQTEKHPERSESGRRRSMERQQSEAMHAVDSVQTAMNKLGKHEPAADATAASTSAGHASESPKIAAVHPQEDELKETKEQVAGQFGGIVSRLTAGSATMVYISAGGRLLGLFSLLVFMTTQTCRIMSDLWIKQWSADLYALYPSESQTSDPGYSDRQHEATKTYILSYMGFVIGFIMLLLTRDGVFSIFSKRAATNLHNSLFKRVLGAPFLFFLRTPLGDVLNSFAKDQDTIDEALPDTVHMTTIYLMILLTSLAIVTVSINYYAIMTAALFLAFFMMQKLYLPAATTLKRWAGDSASEVFVHVDESLHGMDVIRAFDAVDYFIQENVHRINVHHLALFNTEQTHLWLAFWCDFFGALLVVATCLFSVALKETVGAANVGLAISNTIQVLVFFTWVVRGVADSVSMWDAVERITSFATNVPQEGDVEEDANSKALVPVQPGGNKQAADAALQLADVKVDLGPSSMEQWPRKGDLRFDGVCLRYFPGAPLALKHVTFHIQDCEKVGVVGRTGSGKTTLLMGLFRMFKLARGRILLDGVDIATLPLSEVRKRIAIIPQEPVMFKGTVRSNLDPFGEASDAALWEALDMVNLKGAIAEMGGLDSQVQEGGGNFSLGMKQLVCMARCVLKKTRLLVLDEATAAMDLQTDSLIQRTIRKVFRDRTTITIAHRLDTIIFSDKILAMAAGRLKEFDSPTTLLRNPHSMFNMLVEDTGPHASMALRNMAERGPQDEEEMMGAALHSTVSAGDTDTSNSVLLKQPEHSI